MFEESLIIMNKNTQQGPAGTIVTWSEGAVIIAKMQISNMLDVQIAQAQGVKPTGYLVVDTETAKNITMDTYLKYPKGDCYIRVADEGVVEAGKGFFRERQYAAQAVKELPR